MEEIPLTKGYVAIVDDEDYDWLFQNRYRWYAVESRPDRIYAIDVMSQMRMHRAIAIRHGLIKAGSSQQIDHKDRDSLNNRLVNLRIATHAQQSANSRTYANKRNSRYRGVYKVPNSKSTWRAAISAKQTHLGCYPTQEEAARAYDKAAKELYGEFARLNFP